ncbi:MAG: carboxylate--amine ligase, partial [Nitrospina sp.]|nr:carboxylate--amine ligase [Nitrospina sp.]
GLRSYFQKNGAKPLFVVVGRGGPNLIRGMAYLRDILESLGIPYRFFGHDSAMSEVINYAMAINKWMMDGGKKEITTKMNNK